MRKSVATIIASTTLLSMSLTAYAANIENITPVDNGTVEFSVSSDVVLPSESLEADVKILKDLVVSYAYKDSGEQNKAILNLTYDLHKNTSYNLLGITGPDVNVDFTIGNDIPAEIKVQDPNVEKIKVLDSKTLEVYYTNPIEEDELLYKILRDLGTQSETVSEDGKVRIETSSPIEDFSAYILLVNTLKDANGTNVALDEVYNEFETTSGLAEKVVVEEKEVANAPEEVKEEVVEEEGNLEEVAMNAAGKTPDTGAATWVLLLATFGMSSFFFLKNRRK